MKHIVIIGTAGSGKSTTIGAISKALNPSKIFSIDFSKNKPTEVPLDTKIINGTYVIEVGGKYILIVAGAPTEQNILITDIIKHVTVTLNIDIFFAIVAKRLFEKRKGFDTIHELDKQSECIYTERVVFIKGTNPETIETNPEFIKRVNGLVKIIKTAL